MSASLTSQLDFKCEAFDSIGMLYCYYWVNVTGAEIDSIIKISTHSFFPAPTSFQV